MLPRAKQKELLVAVVTIITAIVFAPGSSSLADALPSLTSIKTLNYSHSTSETHEDILGYSAVSDVINACEAYSKGRRVLPTFHEPVLTRGDVGISVFRKSSPSVVLVLTANFKDDKVTDSALGTGVIIDPTGYILTNWHVVNGFDSAIVFLKPVLGTEPEKNSGYGVKLIALNEAADLALLKIVKPPNGLAPVKFGDLAAIQVAEDIHIIGHPHGNLWSYSTGVISQIRDQYDWKYSDGSKHLARVLQMQTAINPGNSGGPVLDNNSNMLGLVAMSEEGQNLNYAVAIDVIKAFVTSSQAARTRGLQPKMNSEKGEEFIGHTESGSFAITKTAYPNLVTYFVRDTSGTAIELFAETQDGAILTGFKPNAFGGFSEWTYKPAQGETVFVKSSGIAPDVVSSAKID
jgi:S1-C subfamily serine protease